jgi:hypothetical protein
MRLIDLLLLIDGKLAWAHVYKEEETATIELVSCCFYPRWIGEIRTQ